jgi:hypothetical protein
MPVIRLSTPRQPTEPGIRPDLVEILQAELSGKSSEPGLLVFEIPLRGTDHIDVMVVWDKWGEWQIPSDERTEIIRNAFAERSERILQALGVTTSEVREQNLLPYAVVPLARPGEIEWSILRQAMLRHGGLIAPGEKVELRLPTWDLAEEVHRKLVDEVPKGYWSIVTTPDRVY